MKKRRQAKQVGTVLRNLARSWGQENQYLQAVIINHWEEIVGTAIASNTKKINIYAGKLYLEVTSSVLKNELLILRDQMKQKINDYVAKNFIHTIIIL